MLVVSQRKVKCLLLLISWVEIVAISKPAWSLLRIWTYSLKSLKISMKWKQRRQLHFPSLRMQRNLYPGRPFPRQSGAHYQRTRYGADLFDLGLTFRRSFNWTQVHDARVAMLSFLQRLRHRISPYIHLQLHC